ncbi:MAG TPA: metallopeptidase TldD-related protein [Solirubrobacteraceae bacterium]|nr:metallopeptidase TldD-related protein [Solirubrobacteraceae bacterium]
MKVVADAHETPLQTAQRALSLAGEGHVQVTVVRERSLMSRFARSAPTQATAVEDTSVEILVLRDGHAGLAATNRLDGEALRMTVRSANDAARAAAHGGAGPHPGLAEPAAAAPGHGGFDEATARLDPTQAGAALRTTFAVAAEHGLEAFGAWTAGAVRTAIASSRGAQLEEELTDSFMKVVCRDASGRSGYASATASSAGEIDPAAVAARAASKVSAVTPATLGPGSYPVVLEPEAVGVLLEFLGDLAFNGLAHVEGRGALSGRLGASIAAPAIDLTDAPRSARTLPRSFDLEAVPKATVTLIAGGVARGVVHDLRSAALAGDGTSSTGHATAPGGSPYGPSPTNLVLGGGDAADVAALCAPIERGIYVTRLWYVNTVRDKETLLTGMTREGTFLIEDGQISRPLRDVRFTDSVLRLLDATEALTRERRLVSEGEFYGRRCAHGVLSPALRADGFRVTGATANQRIRASAG